MGCISNQVLGDAQGKVGHIVFKLRKGVNVMGKAPSKRATLPNAKELAVSVAPNYGFNFTNPVVTVGATSVQLESDALGVG